MTIGQRIRKVRELKGFKQDTMAERLGMSQANYSKLESDDADMSFSRLEEIAKALEVQLSDIVDFDKKVFFNQTNSPYSNSCNVNSPISINDKNLFEEIIQGKDKIIAILEKQISLMEAMQKSKEK